MGKTCAFLACHEAETCCLAGGCVRERFGSAPTKASELKKGARALNGILPSRTNRDPVWVPRRRKALTR